MSSFFTNYVSGVLWLSWIAVLLLGLLLSFLGFSLPQGSSTRPGLRLHGPHSRKVLCRSIGESIVIFPVLILIEYTLKEFLLPKDVSALPLTIGPMLILCIVLLGLRTGSVHNRVLAEQANDLSLSAETTQNILLDKLAENRWQRDWEKFGRSPAFWLFMALMIVLIYLQITKDIFTK